MSDNRVIESTAKPTSPAACPKYRPVGWSVTVDLHKATRNYRPCHSEQTRHGDKNWKHNHAIAGVLPRHPAESSTGSSLGVLRRRGVVGNDSLRAYARDPQGRWHHYRCPSKACRAATGGLLISVSSLLVATGISHIFTSAIMITSIVTVAAFAALTAADEVAWSGYAYVDSAFDSGILLTVCSTHYRKTLSVPA